MFENKTEKLKLLKWLSKTIIAVYWFSGGVQTDMVVVEYLNESKCIKQTSNYMYRNTPELILKS